MNPRARRTSLALVALLAAACGKRGDPQPPLRITPQPVSELRIEQRGDKLVVSLVAPRGATDGQRLPVLDIEIQRADQDGDFARLARSQTQRAAPGEALVQSEPLPPLGTNVRVAARAIARGRASALAGPLALRIQPQPPAPTDFTATLSPTGVVLRWTAPPEPAPSPEPSPSPSAGEPSPAPSPTPSATPSLAPSAVPAGAPASPVGALASPSPSPSPTPPVRGFFVYRRSKDGEFTRPITPTPGPGALFEDLSAKPGEEWCYAVRYVASAEPLVESASAPEACIAVKDVGFPAPPAGVAVVVRAAAVELSWSASPEPDLAGYRVYRAVPGGAPERLAELPAGETRYVDRTATSGQAVIYTITAFDTAGNEGAPSAPLQIRP